MQRCLTGNSNMQDVQKLVTAREEEDHLTVQDVVYKSINRTDINIFVFFTFRHGNAQIHTTLLLHVFLLAPVNPCSLHSGCSHWLQNFSWISALAFFSSESLQLIVWIQHANAMLNPKFESWPDKTSFSPHFCLKCRDCIPPPWNSIENRKYCFL